MTSEQIKTEIRTISKPHYKCVRYTRSGDGLFFPSNKTELLVNDLSNFFSAQLTQRDKTIADQGEEIERLKEHIEILKHQTNDTKHPF